MTDNQINPNQEPNENQLSDENQLSNEELETVAGGAGGDIFVIKKTPATPTKTTPPNFG
jgi:hypothetical protein